MPLVAAAAGRNDRLALRRAVHAGLRAYAVVALAALILAVVITANIVDLVPVSPDLWRELGNACSIALAGYFLMPLGPFQVLLEARGRRATIGLWGTVQAVVTTALALHFARAGLDLEGQFLAVLIGQATFRVGLAIAARSTADGFRGVLTEPPDHASTTQLRQLDPGAFLSMLAGRVGYYTDNIIIAIILGPRQVVSFFLTQRMASLGGVYLLGVARTGQDVLNDLAGDEQREAFHTRLLDQTRSIAGLGVAALVPVAVWNGAFIARWIGEPFFGGDILTVLSCANAWLLAMLTLWGWCFSETGLARKLVPVAVVNAVVNLAVSVWATRHLGLVGPLVGTTVATAAVNLWWVPLLLRRHFQVPTFRLLWAAAVPLLWGAPVSFALWTWAQRHPPAGWVPMLAGMAATGVVLGILWWLLALNAAGRAELRMLLVARRQRRTAA